MSDLADFLELVHTAATRWQSVVASGEYVLDLGAVRAGAAMIFGASPMNFPPPPGMRAMPTGIERRPFRMSARTRRFVRVEQTGEDRTIAILRPDGTATCGSSGEWSFEVTVDPFRIPRGRMPIRFGGPVGGPQAFGMITMLDPASLLGTCRFEFAEEVEIDGRPALQSSGRPRPSLFPLGPGNDDILPTTTRVDLAVDRETGILLLFAQLTEAGPVASRTLRIEEVDTTVDDALFAMPADIEDTKASRGKERFDDPAALAANVNFGVYMLDPEPAGTTPLCMRESASSARITYLTGFQTLATGRVIQPFSVTSARRNAPESVGPGESWELVEQLGESAWIWSFEEDDKRRSHVRISFGDTDVELSGEFSRAEALRLAHTLRRA